MQTRKDELTEALIAYFLAHGLSDLSLRPLAAAVGTSARLLIYHYGSKEGLIAEVLGVMQSRLRASFARLAETPADAREGPLLKRFWKWAIGNENIAHLKLIYELQILADRLPDTYGQLARRNAFDWLDVVEAALPPSPRRKAFATLCCAVFDGLFLELMTTGDRKRTTQALDAFIETVVHARAHAAHR